MSTSSTRRGCKAYFDVGNVVFYGFPQDWIRVLGRRIVKVHLKDFQLDRPNGRFSWRNLGEGDIDWTAVRRALAEVGYAGYVTTEVAGGDASYLKDLAQPRRSVPGGSAPRRNTVDNAVTTALSSRRL